MTTSTEELIRQGVDKNQLQAVFEQQQERALQLRKESAHDRITRLKKLRDWILAHKEEIREALKADFQKPVAETDLSEIYVATSEIRHAISHLKKWMKPTGVAAPLTMLGTKSWIQYEPKGVCLIISPWNFPFNLALGPIVSAIAAGNTIILKPSEMTPHTSKLMETMAKETFAAAELSVVQGGVDASQALLQLPFDHIFFTGSPQVGKIVMEAAAKNLSSVTLELGGKSPTIIDDTADIKDATKKLVFGKFMNNGQTCVAPDYILIHESKKEDFLSQMKEEITSAYDPRGKGIPASKDYARVINDRNYDRLIGMVDGALASGAKLYTGNGREKESRYLSPTIITDVPEDSALMQEEIFGPVLPVVTYTDLDEAIAFINKKPKPLALYIFSKSKKNTKRVLNATSAGGTGINDVVLQFLHLNLPFGGVNNSGIGKSHGYFGFLAFSNERAVVKQRIGFTASTLLRPPYGPLTRKILDLMIKYF